MHRSVGETARADDLSAGVETAGAAEGAAKRSEIEHLAARCPGKAWLVTSPATKLQPITWPLPLTAEADP